LQDADFDTVDETPPSRRPASKRRTRAAEVHNMSERVSLESFSCWCHLQLPWCVLDLV
jgi:hypothetical protein